MDPKQNFLYTGNGMNAEERNAFAAATPGANSEDIFQAENGMFKDNLGEYRDKNGIKYLPDGIPALTFPNTKGWEQPTHWAHPTGSGLNPEDYPELESSFYEDPELKLRVRKPYYQNAMRTLQNRAANAPAAPAGMSSASQTAPGSAGQSTDQDEWTVGRVASQIWDGLTDPRLAEGAKTAAKYGLIGAGIGAASIGASATAGLAGAGLLPGVASGAGSALTGTAARIAAAGAPAVARAKRAGEAVERAAQQIETTLKHPGIIQGIGEFGAGTADPNPPSATSLPMSLGAGAKKLFDETLFSEE